MQKIQHMFQCITATKCNGWKSFLHSPHPTELTQNNKSWKFQFNWKNPLKISFLKGKNSSFWENELYTYGNRNCQNKTSPPYDSNSVNNQTSIFFFRILVPPKHAWVFLMTVQSLSFSLGAIQWRQVTVSCNKVNFLVSFCLHQALSNPGLELRKGCKKEARDQTDNRVDLCKEVWKDFILEQNVVSSNIAFSYILKIILAHFHSIAYFLLFTRVIANTTPVLVFRIFVFI